MLLFCLASIETEENKNKFEQLYNRYNSLVYYIANEFLDNKFAAEDCQQDVFTYLAQHLDMINDDISHHSVKKFISIITTAKAIDIYRKDRKYSLGMYDDFFADLSEIQDDETDFSDTNTIDLSNAIDRLPDEYKYIFYLKYYCELTGEEISEICGISHSLVRKRLMLARKMIKKYLER